MTASPSCHYQANRPTCYMLVNIYICICVEFVLNWYVFFVRNQLLWALVLSGVRLLTHKYCCCCYFTNTEINYLFTDI